MFLTASIKNKPDELLRGARVYLKIDTKYDNDQGAWFDQGPQSSLKGFRPASTASSDISGIVPKWMDECIKSHKRCNSSHKGFRPTRIIDVGAPNEQMVRVGPTAHLPAKLPFKYAALSYCWGSNSCIGLTSANTASLNSGIAVHKLPKTIQHVIHVTRSLGLRWLWVDSLCILQNSNEEKTHQITSNEFDSMFEVYKNCFLCIAALGSSDNEGGGESVVALPHWTTNLNGGFAKDAVDPDWALHRRGWVLQERLLPPRTLLFGSYLEWECHEMVRDEFGPIPVISRFLGPLEPSPDEVYDHWRQILRCYTRSSLTLKSDREFAIAGVISAVERRMSWRNIAGLWEPYLVHELLWERLPESDSVETGISPSWPWISI
ncbi:HET-domain-containing protein, partial [Eremomyces bilateralis CBS 781.70]